MGLRVIAGSKKGYKLDVPSALKLGSGELRTRPMTDRAKSALFSKIDDYIEGANVLDLYAGSGALGIESLSRGAKHVTFVDLSEESIGTIKKNLKKTGFLDKTTLVKQDANKFLKKAIKEGAVFDIIFISPPWAIVGTHAIKQSGEVVRKKGIIISEHSRNYNLPEQVGRLSKIDERQYGKTVLTYFQKQQ